MKIKCGGATAFDYSVDEVKSLLDNMHREIAATKLEAATERWMAGKRRPVQGIGVDIIRSMAPRAFKRPEVDKDGTVWMTAQQMEAHIASLS